MRIQNSHFYLLPSDFSGLDIDPAMELIKARFKVSLLNFVSSSYGHTRYTVADQGRRPYVQAYIRDSSTIGTLTLGKYVPSPTTGVLNFQPGIPFPNIALFTYTSRQDATDLTSDASSEIQEKLSALIEEREQALGELAQQVQDSDDQFFIPDFSKVITVPIIRIPSPTEKEVCSILSHIFAPNFDPDPMAWQKLPI